MIIQNKWIRTMKYITVQWLRRKKSTPNIRVTNAWKDATSATDQRAVWPSSCGLKGELIERRRKYKTWCTIIPICQSCHTACMTERNNKYLYLINLIQMNILKYLLIIIYYLLEIILMTEIIIILGNILYSNYIMHLSVLSYTLYTFFAFKLKIDNNYVVWRISEARFLVSRSSV